MRTLERGALDWVEQGLTTLVEVERVVGSSKDMFEQEKKEEAGPPRILIVDDDEETRVLQRTILEDEGCEVEEAGDGEEAIAVLRKDPAFSLVLLDLKMPGMDGLEVLRAIRGAVDTHALPVMISTGNDSEESETELLEAGADDYLEKSAQPERFVARIKAVLRRSMM